MEKLERLRQEKERHPTRYAVSMLEAAAQAEQFETGAEFLVGGKLGPAFEDSELEAAPRAVIAAAPSVLAVQFEEQRQQEDRGHLGQAWEEALRRTPNIPMHIQAQLKSRAITALVIPACALPPPPLPPGTS